ncbi:hypothetical protein WG907_05325 [Sphingobium sp. AN558]
MNAPAQQQQPRQHRQSRDWRIEPSPDKKPGHWEQTRNGFERVGGGANG